MNKLNHIQYNLEYHILWTTKHKYNILTGLIAKRCRNVIIQTCNTMEINILKGEIDKNYIYLLISCPPNICVEEIVSTLKKKSSKVLLHEYKELKHKYHGQIWTDKYFCQSGGKVNNKIIKKYISEQPDEYETIFKID